jgi:MFS family permease
VAVHAPDLTIDNLAEDKAAGRPSGFAWTVMALTLGLLLSDYMCRQLLNAVFPLLKADWSLTDTQLGSLGGVVPLAVGVLTLPLSLLADRIGRARSIAIMAVLWSLATVACGLTVHYGQMLAARMVVGIGEAAYGSVGCAVVVSVFPRSMRATIVAMFTAGGIFGSVLGLASGGLIAEQLGWRWAFAIMGLIGLGLGAIYPLAVRESRIAPQVSAKPAPVTWTGGLGRFWTTLFPSRSIVWTYLASGVQLFIPAALISWLPSYLNRYYAMGPAKAASTAAVFVLASGVGMIACGSLADRASRRVPGRQGVVAAAYCAGSAVLLFAALSLPAGPAQLVLLGLGMLIASGSLGPAGAVVAARADPAAYATAFAMLTVINNALGLAPGPFLTGVAADRLGLLGALKLLPLAGLLAAAGFMMANRAAGAGERR